MFRRASPLLSIFRVQRYGSEIDSHSRTLSVFQQNRFLSVKDSNSNKKRSMLDLSVVEESNVEPVVEITDEKRFADLKRISPATLKAITGVLGFENMTGVQSRVIDAASDDKSPDLVVQSRTGTGKTLAYLIPTIERLARNPPVGVGAIIVAPTRELCMQITADCEKLLTYHKMEVVCLAGGQHRRNDQDLIRRKRPHILVCTVGRLMDHLEGTYMFHSLLEGLDTLVLDEADRLLEVGKIQDLRALLGYLPAEKRTLLFSATISDAVKDVAARACRSNFDIIDCVPKNEQITALKVYQEVALVPAADMTTALYNILADEMRQRPFDYKIIVFFQTARMTAFMSSLFREQMKLALHEIHRRRDGPSRLLASQRFAAETTSVLFSSDVSARGMDYKGVTLVVQFGAPQDTQQYVHRVGRTARAGEEGRAVLVLPEGEKFFLQDLKKNRVPVKVRSQASGDIDPIVTPTEITARALGSWRTKTQLIHQATAAFASILTHSALRGGHRSSGVDDTVAVATARGIMLSSGLAEVPAISKRMAEELGLDGHPLLRVQEGLDDLHAVQMALKQQQEAGWKSEERGDIDQVKLARQRKLAALESKFAAKERDASFIHSYQK